MLKVLRYTVVAWAVKVHGRFRLSVMVSLEPEESQCTKRKGRFLSFSSSGLMPPPPPNAEEMVIERIIPLSAKNKAAAFVPTYDKNGEGVLESGG